MRACGAAEEDALCARWPRPGASRLAITYRRRTAQHRLQGRQHPRLLRALWRSARTRHHARRRQRDAGVGHAAAGARDADRPASSASCRRWSSACRRQAHWRASFSSACGSACAPTRSAAPGGRAIAAPIGDTTRCCGCNRSSRHCELPAPGAAGAIPSHDQIEAVLMRRAGYEVRVLPEEDLGWEENPPTLH